MVLKLLLKFLVLLCFVQATVSGYNVTTPIDHQIGIEGRLSTQVDQCFTSVRAKFNKLVAAAEMKMKRSKCVY
jgi:hypothetical protein